MNHFSLALEKTVKELIEEESDDDTERQRLKQVIIKLAESGDTGIHLPPVIRFARFDRKWYSGKLGKDERVRVFASSLAEVWNLKVKDAADLSGYSCEGGDTFFVWVFVPAYREEVVPASWGEVLKHFPQWMKEMRRRGARPGDS